jgi:hypothetical protein
MSQFDEKVQLYVDSAEALGLNLSKDLISGVAKSLGPSIYNADASLVSSSDKEELERVKTNFLIKKLGLSDGPELDAAIAGVVDQLGSSNRQKHRVLFYALLAVKFGKEGDFN